MDGRTRYLWTVVWRMGHGGRTTSEERVAVEEIAVPAGAEERFEALVAEHAARVGHGATRGGSVVVGQSLLRRSDEPREAVRGALGLSGTELEGRLREMGATVEQTSYRSLALSRPEPRATPSETVRVAPPAS